MRLGWDTYACEKCGHFVQDISLHDINERDGGHLKYCQCAYCLKEDARTRKEVMEVSTQAKMQPGPFEQLKAILEDASWNHDSLADYVRELERHAKEDDVFLRLAFENASSGGGAYSGRGLLITSVVSELYEPLDADHKLEIRRWWHEKVRRETNQFDDLRARLYKLT